MSSQRCSRISLDALLWVLAIAAIAALVPLLLASRSLALKVERIEGVCVEAYLPLHLTRLKACGELLVGDRIEVGSYYRFRFEPGEIGTTRRNFVVIERPEDEPLRLRLRSLAFLE